MEYAPGLQDKLTYDRDSSNAVSRREPCLSYTLAVIPFQSGNEASTIIRQLECLTPAAEH